MKGLLCPQYLFIYFFFAVEYSGRIQKTKTKPNLGSKGRIN